MQSLVLTDMDIIGIFFAKYFLQAGNLCVKYRKESI